MAQREWICVGIDIKRPRLVASSVRHGQRQREQLMRQGSIAELQCFAATLCRRTPVLQEQVPGTTLSRSVRERPYSSRRPEAYFTNTEPKGAGIIFTAKYELASGKGADGAMISTFVQCPGERDLGPYSSYFPIELANQNNQAVQMYVKRLISRAS